MSVMLLPVRLQRRSVGRHSRTHPLVNDELRGALAQWREHERAKLLDKARDELENSNLPREKNRKARLLVEHAEGTDNEDERAAFAEAARRITKTHEGTAPHPVLQALWNFLTASQGQAEGEQAPKTPKALPE
jgi:hypothetical protein